MGIHSTSGSQGRIVSFNQTRHNKTRKDGYTSGLFIENREENLRSKG